MAFTKSRLSMNYGQQNRWRDTPIPMEFVFQIWINNGDAQSLKHKLHWDVGGLHIYFAIHNLLKSPYLIKTFSSCKQISLQLN